jgi:hypothetical protein
MVSKPVDGSAVVLRSVCVPEIRLTEHEEQKGSESESKLIIINFGRFGWSGHPTEAYVNGISSA